MACREAPPKALPGGPLSATLIQDQASGRLVIRVKGWSSAELEALTNARVPVDRWTSIVSLHVGGVDDIAVAARYTVSADSVDLVPAYPLDPGRTYTLRINASEAPLARPEAP